MKKRKIFPFLIIVIVIISAFAFGYKKGTHKNETNITSSLIENRLSSVKDLVTTQYHYKNMASFDNHNTFYGWQVPFTEKKFIISYEGDIKLGVDLKYVDVSINNKNIDIEIPQAKIISNSIDESSIKVFDEKNSIFNPIKIEDYTSFADNQKTKVEKDAIKKGIFKSANENSINVIKELFKIDPIFKDYNININIKK